MVRTATGRRTLRKSILLALWNSPKPVLWVLRADFRRLCVISQMRYQRPKYMRCGGIGSDSSFVVLSESGRIYYTYTIVCEWWTALWQVVKFISLESPWNMRVAYTYAWLCPCIHEQIGRSLLCAFYCNFRTFTVFVESCLVSIMESYITPVGCCCDVRSVVAAIVSSLFGMVICQGWGSVLVRRLVFTGCVPLQYRRVP